MNVQLVVFDLAGTTVRDPGGVNGCFRGALEKFGVDITSQAANDVMGIPKPEAIRTLLRQFHREDLLGSIPAIHAEFDVRMKNYYLNNAEVGEVPGATRVFERCKQSGVLVTVNTGFFRDVTDVLLTRLGWKDNSLIDASITSDESPRGRPYADMIIALMKMTGVSDPNRVAKIGDTPADLLEGHNAKCGWIVGVTNGTHRREQLSCHPHTHLIESVADLPDVLGLQDI